MRIEVEHGRLVITPD
ncbi:hypothetical protein [Paraburkholderia antibiotica]|nr:hypothetical protein [Paraburkholderia antibiotica]